MNQSIGILIISAIVLMVGGLSYWTGFIYNESGSEILEIVTVTSRNLGYVELTISNGGTSDAQLDYILANGLVVFEEDRVIPYGAQIEIEIPVAFEPNSPVMLWLYTVSGKDFEEIMIISETSRISVFCLDSASTVAVEDGWEIVIFLRNVGVVDAVIDRIDVSSPVYSYPELPRSVDYETVDSFKIVLSSGAPGEIIDITIHASDDATLSFIVKLG